MESVELDGQREPKQGIGVPPFLAWADFHRYFQQTWQQGEHVTLVGRTKSGKTSVARNLILLRRYVLVMATKSKDPSLYVPLQRAGFVLRRSWDTIDPAQTPRVIFQPPLTGPGVDARADQADAFAEALSDVFTEGGWCVYTDEARYLSDNLRLGNELETLWLQGRSLGVTMVAGTQRPVSIPLEAFSQAEHLFLWKETDRRNVDRMAEFSGPAFELVRWLLPRLPRHEFLYINTGTDQLYRSRLELKQG